MTRALVLLTTLLLAACSHDAGSGRPPSSLPPSVQYGTQTSLGQCLTEAQVGIETAIASAIISQGVNRLGASLRAAAGPQTSSVLSRRNVMLSHSNQAPLGPCIYVARGWFFAGPPAATDAENISSGLSNYHRLGLFLADTPDFSFEGRIIRSGDGSAYTLLPVRATFQEPLVSSAIRSDDRRITVAFGIVPLGTAVHEIKSGPMIVLGRMDPGRVWQLPPQPNERRAAEYCSSVVSYGVVAESRRVAESHDCGGRTMNDVYTVILRPELSEWFKVELSDRLQPMTLLAHVTETRDQSAFLTFVADVFDASKTAITTEAQTALIPELREAARNTDLSTAENRATAYDTALVAARGGANACVATPGDAAKRAAARATARAFMQAARADGRNPSGLEALVNGIDISKTDPAGCQALLDRLGGSF